MPQWNINGSNLRFIPLPHSEPTQLATIIGSGMLGTLQRRSGEYEELQVQEESLDTPCFGYNLWEVLRNRNKLEEREFSSHFFLLVNFL